MAKQGILLLSIVMAFACLNFRVRVSAEDTEDIPVHGARFHEQMLRMQELKNSLIHGEFASSISPAPAPSFVPPSQV